MYIFCILKSYHTISMLQKLFSFLKNIFELTKTVFAKGTIHRILVDKQEKEHVLFTRKSMVGGKWTRTQFLCFPGAPLGNSPALQVPLRGPGGKPLFLYIKKDFILQYANPNLTSFRARPGYRPYSRYLQSKPLKLPFVTSLRRAKNYMRSAPCLESALISDTKR